MTPDFLLQLASLVVAGIGMYSAIKSDLTRAILLSERAAKLADRAQERISAHIELHHTTQQRKETP